MIEKSAEAIIRDRGITAPEDIDLEAVAMTLGAAVKIRPLKGCEARIIGNGDRAIVSIDEGGSIERQRFSLGHELGHWQLHRGRTFKCMKEDIGNPNTTKAKEREADSFSADLIMPWFIFKPIALSFPHGDFKAVSALSRRFRTSLTATAIRLIESNAFPALLVCHDQGRRLWFRASKDVPSRWFPQDKVDHESSAFSILYGQAGRDLRQQKVPATAWFDRAEAANHEVLEQSVPYGNGKVLTLIEIFEDDMLEEYEPNARGADDFRW